MLTVAIEKSNLKRPTGVNRYSHSIMDRTYLYKCPPTWRIYQGRSNLQTNLWFSIPIQHQRSLKHTTRSRKSWTRSPITLARCKDYSEVGEFSFFAGIIDYHSHVIRPLLLKIETHTTDPVRELKQTSNITEHRSFFDLRNVFLYCVPNFSRIAAPPIKNFKKSASHRPLVFQ